MSTARTPTGLFDLSVDRHRDAALTVVALAGEEAMNETYRFELTASHALDWAALGALEPACVGSPATLSLHAEGDAGRVLHGVVTALSLDGPIDHERAAVRLWLEPRLALLRLRRGSRIFQDKTVRDIVGELCREWQLEHRFQLLGEHPVRPYTTQHDESDYDFLARLCASEGVAFTFEHPPAEGGAQASEVLVLLDAPYFYEAIAEPDRLAWAARVRDAHGSDAADFRLERRVRPARALSGDYDPRKPTSPLRAQVRAPEELPALGASVPARELLTQYTHAQQAELEGVELRPEDAARALAAARVDTLVATGSSRARRLAPGRTFQLEGHPLDTVNQRWVVTRLRHEGHVPEHATDAASRATYQNRFECVPATTLACPPPRPRGRRHGLETATVTGPPGEAIWTDEQGRVKVKFHWDLAPERDERSSAWLRVGQGWAGAHFGAQFVPRVGMEVLVGFLAGDADRPIVTGTVYNGTHAPPFPLPADKSRSGFRTQSVPGDGHNELSFEDRMGEEQIYLHAERNLDVAVRRDHTLRVARHAELAIGGDLHAEVAGTLDLTVAGASRAMVSGDREEHVLGAARTSVTGNAESRVSGAVTSRVEGAARHEVGGSATCAVREDATLRIDGHLVAVVGRNDARRSATLHVEGGTALSSVGPTEVTSERGIVLRVGASEVHVTPEGIELRAARLLLSAERVEVSAEDAVAVFAKEQASVHGKRIRLRSEAAELGLAKVARLDADSVKLACAPDPKDELPPIEPLPPTVIALEDEDGKPIPGRRYVLVLPDGSERSGVLDADGRAELRLEESGTVLFPDVSSPRKK
ncbi:MAG: type VI secretion system tip protein VgrG [Polyangiaceae bacterium]|nr:type VI secretion system tip protein VgrG [Polyangiaceae bacterium]